MNTADTFYTQNQKKTRNLLPFQIIPTNVTQHQQFIVQYNSHLIFTY